MQRLDPRQDMPTSLRPTIVELQTLARNWGAVLSRGLMALAFGAFTVLAPGVSLRALVLVFGAFALADGVLALVSAVRLRGSERPWWVLVLQGVLGVAVGVLTMIWPAISALALISVIAAWAMVIGVLQVATAIRLRKSLRGEWLLAASGLASIALGVVLAAYPGPGAIGVVLWIGIYALLSGGLLVALAVRLRAWTRRGERRPAATRSRGAVVTQLRLTPRR